VLLSHPRVRVRVASERGITIVEVAVTTALLMIVLLGAFNSFDTISKSQAFQADRSVTINDMRNTLNKMTKELRQATSVTQPASTPSSTLTYVTYVNGAATTITYAVTGTCTSGAPTCTLTRQVGAGNPYTVLKRVTSADVFTPTSATEVTGIQWVEIALSVAPLKSPTTTLTLQSKVNLRNRTAALTGTSS
jgi:Tfp pilus assembly protein PilW